MSTSLLVYLVIVEKICGFHVQPALTITNTNSCQHFQTGPNDTIQIEFSIEDNFDIITQRIQYSIPCYIWNVRSTMSEVWEFDIPPTPHTSYQISKNLEDCLDTKIVLTLGKGLHEIMAIFGDEIEFGKSVAIAYSQKVYISVDQTAQSNRDLLSRTEAKLQRMKTEASEISNHQREVAVRYANLFTGLANRTLVFDCCKHLHHNIAPLLCGKCHGNSTTSGGKGKIDFCEQPSCVHEEKYAIDYSSGRNC